MGEKRKTALNIDKDLQKTQLGLWDDNMNIDTGILPYSYVLLPFYNRNFCLLCFYFETFFSIFSLFLQFFVSIFLFSIQILSDSSEKTHLTDTPVGFDVLSVCVRNTGLFSWQQSPLRSAAKACHLPMVSMGARTRALRVMRPAL